MFGNLRNEIKKSLRTQKDVFESIFWLFSDKFLKLVVGVFISAWIARYLGPEKFGLLSFATALYYIIVSVPKLGLDKVVVKKLVAKKNISAAILSSAFRIRLLFGFVTAVFTIAIAYFTSSEQLKFTVIALTSLAFLVPSFEVIDLYFQSLIRSKKSVIARNGALIIASFIRIYLIIYKYEVIYFIGAFVLELFLYAAFLLLSYKKYGYLTFKNAKAKIELSLLVSGFPLIFSTFLTETYMRVDQLMLEFLTSTTELGYYSAAYKLSQIVYFIPVVIGNSIFPKLILLKENNFNQYIRYFRLYFTGLIFTATIISIGAVVFSNEIIHMLFGVEYAVAADILKIHVWSSVFIFLGVATVQFFIAENATHVIISRTILAAIANVVLNYFLIPEYGGFGAAYATLISQGLMILFTFFSRSFYQKVIFFRP